MCSGAPCEAAGVGRLRTGAAVKYGFPDIHPERFVRAEALGMLWRRWYRTSLRTTEIIMKSLAKHSKGSRKFFEILIKKENKRRRSMAGSVTAAPTDVHVLAEQSAIWMTHLGCKQRWIGSA